MKRLNKRDEFLLNWFFEHVQEKGYTPDFSKEDWDRLQKRANEGDITSIQMYISLLNKVMPLLDPYILKQIGWTPDE